MIRALKSISSFGILGAALMLTATTRADGISSQITDGKPWFITTPDGMNMWLTLNPDGTGTMNVAIMSKSLTWTPTADGLCLKGLPQGEGTKCLVMRQRGDGYEGTDPDGKILQLKRAKQRSR